MERALVALPSASIGSPRTEYDEGLRAFVSLRRQALYLARSHAVQNKAHVVRPHALPSRAQERLRPSLRRHSRTPICPASGTPWIRKSPLRPRTLRFLSRSNLTYRR